MPSRVLHNADLKYSSIVRASAVLFFVFAFGGPVAGCATVLGLDSGEPLDTSPPPGQGPGTGDEDAKAPIFDAGPDVTLDDAGCGNNQKKCANECVGIDDPAYGCGPANCDPCPSDNATATCKAGACGLNCKPGYDDCDPNKSGCETKLGTDQNCAGCDKACGVDAPFCDISKTPPVCSTTCNPPKTACSPTDCWDIQNDPDHCGNTCQTLATCIQPPHADRACFGGSCKYTCQPPYSNCSQPIGPSGCPYLPNSDIMHCGPSCEDCTTKTPPPNMSLLNCNGTCQFQCVSPYRDCDINAPGCECYGTCSGTQCIPFDAGQPDGGSCTIDAGGCTPQGTVCGTNAQCCGCKCVSNQCCYQPGTPAPGGMAMFCCSGSCDPVAMPEGGSMCRCN
jgi:hypothetical protein